MSITSVTLLAQVQQGPHDSAWQRLVDFYSPLITAWLRGTSVPSHDVDDVVQEVLSVVVRKISKFKREPRTGAFRRWLHTITLNCVRGFWRAKRGQPHAADDDLEQIADDHGALSKIWQREHEAHVARRLLNLIRPCFERRTWLAFQRVVLEGMPADQAAQELGMTVNAVFIAKSRVLQRLRLESQELLD